jgi:hypothetical protein
MLRKVKASFGFQRNNPKLIRGRARASNTWVASPKSALLNYNRLPFLLVFVYTVRINFTTFIFFRSSSNILFTLKTKFFNLNLFSYSLSYLISILPEHLFSVIRISVGLLKVNTKIIYITNYTESFPRYSLSFSSFSKLINFNTDTGYYIILLPSNQRKLFYFLTSVYFFKGADLPTTGKFSIEKAGTLRKLGFRPKVRGVAMNPVDHPHGGRTKSIRLQRTPWGKVTKLKN